MGTYIARGEKHATRRHVIVDSMSLESFSDPYWGSCNKNLIDQQPQIKGFAGCYYYGYRFPSGYGVIRFQQESVDTTLLMKVSSMMHL